MIKVSNLTKVYKAQGLRHDVLKGISFEVPAGRRLALFGGNGAGKSTLIRLLAKIELPTTGTVTHGMSVSWPLAFSGTFQGSLSGVDNIKFISRIYAVDYVELKEFVEDFAQLGKFLYQPVRTYSAGMRARLAFGLSIAIEFDCYLIDEVLMVGDKSFHKKCHDHLFARKSGRSMIMASHNTTFVGKTCDSGLVLNRGHAEYFEDVGDAIEAYNRLHA